MVSPSKKLQASAPFFVPETNANFPLAVVKPSGWEIQAPVSSERDEEARDDISLPNELTIHDSNVRSATPRTVLTTRTDPAVMAKPASSTDKSAQNSKGHRANDASQGARSSLNGKPKHVTYTQSGGSSGRGADGRGGNDALATNGGFPSQSSTSGALEQRGEKRRLEEEDHEEEEAAEVEKAMVDEDGEVDRPDSSKSHHNHLADTMNGSKPPKKAKMDAQTEDEGDLKIPTRSSPRKSAAPRRTSSVRKARPVAGVFVGAGRVVPVKDRPFGEATCHRCGHMNSQPPCILHSDESRCDKCIVNAQGCWWRKGPNDYESIAGAKPQKKLVDRRDEGDLIKVKEEKVKRVEKLLAKGNRRREGNKDEEGRSEGDDSRPLTRKSLRVAKSTEALSSATIKTPKTPVRRRDTRRARRSTRTSGKKAQKQKSVSNTKRNRGRGQGSESGSENESESESERESRSESGSESSELSEPPPPKPLKGKAARKEEPSADQRLQRYERAEGKIRDELWALSWEKERLVKTERRLQEDLEDILAKKAQIRAGPNE